MKRLYIFSLLLLDILSAFAQQPAELQHIMSYMRNAMNFNKAIPQEKVYLHIDNTGYFMGETIWFKAYVVRADYNIPTNLSKVVYVELVNPTGDVVETRKLKVSNGCAYGNIKVDSIFGTGFYELRAYTRYMTNWGNGGIFSRVIPIFKKPQTEGDYSQMVMDDYSHKKRLPNLRDTSDDTSDADGRLRVRFYPEGGHLVEGVPCNVAFEVRDNNGELIDIQGTLSDGRTIATTHLGKGEFTITPTASAAKLTMQWNDKTWHFTLPKAEQSGVTISYDAAKRSATIRSKGVAAAAYTLLCRGKLLRFERIKGNADISLKDALTGVNELIVYDSEAQPLASRLFFADNHDYGKPLTVEMTSGGETVGKTTTLAPYAPVQLSVSGVAPLNTVSIAVHDAQTDEPGYDNGNIMTDMLLSSELKGFIPYPAQYFPSADGAQDAAKVSQAMKNLDLLMKVQGWRRYKRAEQLRYEPEKGLTFEGTVYTVPAEANILEYEDRKSVV